MARRQKSCWFGARVRLGPSPVSSVLSFWRRARQPAYASMRPELVEGCALLFGAVPLDRSRRPRLLTESSNGKVSL